MTKIKKGDTVTLEYEGKLEDGTVFDSSTRDGKVNPLTFEVGAGQVIPGFDSAVIGMEKGEEKEFTLPVKEAYGERDESRIQKIPTNAMKMDQEPKVGMMLGIQTQTGQQIAAPITKVEKDAITIDLNHPLAGKALTFKIKIVDVKEK